MDYRRLKGMLHEELDRIAEKDELDMKTLEMVDKLAHSLKCIATVEAMDDYSEGNSYRKRDSMGRYTSEGRYTYDDRYPNRRY